MSSLKNKDINKIGDIYGSILNNLKRDIVKESKGKEEIGEAPLLPGGPTEKGGFVPSKIDRRKMSDKELSDNLYNVKNLSDEDNEEPSNKKKKKKNKKEEEVQKIAQESLNNFMRSKSIFDKLYESVLGNEGMGEMEETQELDALGIDAEGGEDGDEVTFTLDRETAQKLHDVLMSVLGGEEDSGEEGDELGGEETSEDNEGFAFEEDEETLSKEPNMGKQNKVGNLKVKSSAGNSAVTDKVGSDGDLGHALVNAKQPNMGTSNKVGSLKTGTGAFEQ